MSQYQGQWPPPGERSSSQPYNPTFGSTPSPTVEKPKKKRRVFMWVFLAIQALFLIWLIAGFSGGSGAEQACSDPSQFSEYYTKQDCINAYQTGEAIGAGIGLFLIVGLWVAVDIILGITWLVTRKRFA